MIKKLLTLVFLTIISNEIISQVVAIDAPLYGTSGNVVTGTNLYAASEAIYYESEIGASNFVTPSTAINKIEFSVNTVGTPTTFGNFNVYMKDVPLTTTTLATGTYTTTGYTLVYSGSITVASTGWVGVSLTTPFTRTAGNNLQILIERADNATHVGYIFNCVNSAATSNCRRYNSTTALSGTTSLVASAFRAAVRLSKTYPNDLGVDRIETLGKIPAVAAFPHSIKAVVTNYGTNTIAAGTVVSLNVSGSNIFTNTQLTSSLAPGATQTITFDPISSMVLGTNTVTVSVPSDDNTTNNSSSFTQIVVNNAFSYANNGAVTSGVGFGTGSGLLLNSHKLPTATSITGVKLQIMTSSNTIFGVVTNSVGEILAQTPDYAVQASDSNSYKTLTFTTPVSRPADSTFFIGIGQRAGTYGYYPVGTQAESPARPNTYASAALTGGGIAYYTTLGRFVFDGVIPATTPVSLADFIGTQTRNGNLLSWTTLNELNNKGFDLERSADGVNFSSIASIASKAINGNSTSQLSYDFTDNKSLNGNNYYRLKQADKDGKTTFSQVVLIKGNKVNATSISAIYPNPAKDKLSITLSSATSERVTLSIIDVTGKVLIQKSIMVNIGDLNITENISNLNQGNYLVKLSDASGNTTDLKKIVKQ